MTPATIATEQIPSSTQGAITSADRREPAGLCARRRPHQTLAEGVSFTARRMGPGTLTGLEALCDQVLEEPGPRSDPDHAAFLQ